MKWHKFAAFFRFSPGSWYWPVRDLKQRGRRRQRLEIVKKAIG